MCGRYALTSSAERLVEFFKLALAPQWSGQVSGQSASRFKPRYNIAPTHEVPVVRLGRGDGARQLDFLRWGLIPWWAGDPGIGSRMINARSETVATSRAFREPLSQRRCLVPADAFYEWKKTKDGRGKVKSQPYCIRMRDGGLFALAGLWERWRERRAEDAAGSRRTIESFTILTTEPNPLVAELHDRMPVIVPRESFGRWLDPETTDGSVLAPLLRAFDETQMTIYPVGRRVGNPANDDAACMERIQLPPDVSDDEAQGTLFA